jgi:hypothetical protein
VSPPDNPQPRSHRATGRDYRIWGRIEKVRGSEQAFRAIAAAAPDLPGASAEPTDVRFEIGTSLEESRRALGRLMYELSAAVAQRGDQVSWIDLRR